MSGHSCVDHADDVVDVAHNNVDGGRDDNSELNVSVVFAFPAVLGEASNAGSTEVGVSSASQTGRLAGSAPALGLALFHGPTSFAAGADGVTFTGSAVGVAGHAGPGIIEIVAVAADGAFQGLKFVALDAVGNSGAGQTVGSCSG